MQWPPDYKQEFIRRQNALLQLNADQSLAIGARAYYKTRPVEFINDWCVTYDPRNAGTGKPTLMPFMLFPKQVEFIHFLQYCLKNEEHGLCEKSRDMGISWECVCFSVWLWLFWDGAAVGFGSRKEEYVDRLGDPKSIFDKIRTVVRYLPKAFLPDGFKWKEHATYMKLINPETGATITGEAGDNIGRGGRTLLYVKDESAHYPRPELIEAALGDNTNVQIDVSSVNGTANVFYRKRQSGELFDANAEPKKTRTSVFIADWRDHPGKTQQWYDDRRAKAENEGLLHVFAQEVDRDYAAAVQGVLIPAKYVKAAIDAHVKLGFKAEGKTIAALDVADEGGDKNALTIRKGVVLNYAEDWGEGDVGVTAGRAVTKCRELGALSLQYDSISVGSGVKAETNRMKRAGTLPKGLEIVPWCAGAGVQNPGGRIIKGDRDSPTNKDFFANLKAQGGWSLRTRFVKTYDAVVNGKEYDPDELISLSSDLPKLHQLVLELSQPTYTENDAGKVVINKTPKGSKSPNLYDSVVMDYFPILKAKFLC